MGARTSDWVKGDSPENRNTSKVGKIAGLLVAEGGKKTLKDDRFTEKSLLGQEPAVGTCQQKKKRKKKEKKTNTTPRK